MLSKRKDVETRAVPGRLPSEGKGMTGRTDGQSISKARIERGLSRRELARRARVSVATVHNLETGKYQPRGTTLRKVLAALQKAPKLPEL